MAVPPLLVALAFVCLTIQVVAPAAPPPSPPPSLSTEHNNVVIRASDLLLESANANISLITLATTLHENQIVTTSVLASLQSNITTIVATQATNAGAATMAQQSLAASVASEVTRASGSEASLSSAIADEAARAVGKEASISLALAQEATRALGVEASIPVLGASLVAETSRALTAEQAISAAVSAEAVRAQGVETAASTSLSLERARAIAAEASIPVLAAALSAEQTRAMGVEQAVSAAVGSEISRARATEASLGTSVGLEQSRAMVAEASIPIIATALSAAISRAQGAEASISLALAAETTRASSAETSLSTGLSAAQARAIGVESSISNALAATSAALSAVDQSLATSVAAEAMRASSIEGSLNNSLAALTTKTANMQNCGQQGYALAPNNVDCTTTGPTAPIPNWRNILTISNTNTAVCVNGWQSNTNVASSGLNLCTRVTTGAACTSIFVNPKSLYSQVNVGITLYQSGSPDALNAGNFGGDALTVWSGNTFLWSFAVGYTTSMGLNAANCPQYGGTMPSSTLNGLWSCGAGASSAPSSGTAFFANPAISSSNSIVSVMGGATLANNVIELRICLDEARTNEEAYIGASFVNVFTPPNALPWRTMFAVTPSNLAACNAYQWNTDSSLGFNACRRTDAGGRCSSLFIPVTGGPYTQVTGTFTLYQFGSTDGFNGGSTYGDSMSIWSGSTFLWTYAVGVSTGGMNAGSNCPNSNLGVFPSSTLDGKWSCQSGNTGTTWTTVLYNNPLFGSSEPFYAEVPATQAELELRFCLNEARSNEDILLTQATVSVR